MSSVPPQAPLTLVDQLRAFFFPRDRDVWLARDCYARLDPFTSIGVALANRYLSLVSVAEAVLTASAASVTFANIPQNFRSLVVVIQARTDRAASLDWVIWQANADGGANYDYVSVYGLNGAAGSNNAFAATAATAAYCDAATSRASCFGGAFGVFPNYRDASIEKQAWWVGGYVAVPSAVTTITAVYGCHWRNTAAITSLVFLPSVGPNFVAASVFQLYGIL